MSTSQALPTEVDLVVVGAGTAGAAVAARAAERSDQRVLLLEAGPDYGPRDSGRWPEDLLDAATMAMVSHDWGYSGEIGGRQVGFNRARVIGGCSSHNAGAVVHGSRLDYDRWAASGNPGWTADELEPLFAAAWERLRVRKVPLSDLTPFQAASMAALEAGGIPAVEDFNDLDDVRGVAPFPINIALDGTRINSAFAYVDPLRDADNFDVAGDAPVERLLLDGNRVAGVVVRRDGEEVEVRASRVALCGGAYGSPSVLQRSGVGAPEVLRAGGVEVAHELPGVGENLHDQPALEVDYDGSDELIGSMREYAGGHWRPDEQVIGKYPSAECSEGFDLHVYPVGGRNPMARDEWRWTVAAAVLTPESRGYVRITGPSSDAALDIDHRYLSDPEGSDLRRLVEGTEKIRELSAQPEFGALLGTERVPGGGIATAELGAYLSEAAVHYYHPAGSCKMGPASDPDAVVDATGAVHGLEGVYVGDASIMPMVISGNTNMPTTVIGEKLGRELARG